MDALDRMFHTLVRNLRLNRPTLLASPFTVEELYQQILPYRHFRRELGLETNQEYELVLLELLTGARGYLDVDDRLRDGLGKELVASSPEPSRIRDYADAYVSINAAAQAMVEAEAPTMSTPQQQPRVSSGVVTPRVSASVSGARCRYCSGALPTGRSMNYCPHCGQNLQVLNCSACGAEIEAGWKFCVSCGKAVA